MRGSLTLCSVALFATISSAQVTFTQSGTFTVPVGVDTITVELVGAGGRGGTNGSGGGGGGGYARGTYAVVPGTSYSIVVGDGGSGLATIVGGLGILAEAGQDGVTVGNPNVGGGGTGGSGIGGQVNRTGGAGGGGYFTYFGGGGGGAAGGTSNGGDGGNTIVWTGICVTPGGAAGTGGGAPGGAGGKGAGFTDVNCNVTDPEGNGDNYGGGGGGGNGINSPGGTGAGGVCIISWNSSSSVHGIDNQYPSLASDLIVDGINVLNTRGGERYELLNISGAVIWQGMDLGAQRFGHLPSGAYVLRMSGLSGSHVFRLVK